MFSPTPKLFIIYTDVWAAATVTLRYRLATYTDVVIVCWLPTTWWWYPWCHNLPHNPTLRIPNTGIWLCTGGVSWLCTQSVKYSNARKQKVTHTQVLRAITGTMFHREGRRRILSDESCKKRRCVLNLRCLFFVWCLSHTNVWWG